ncbi:UNVERIFIED_CONTAM: hypothetical protein H355_005532 [Colinus virginianus]|nr:hypothetical protein H355_005532 [Colinus virginianus]
MDISLFYSKTLRAVDKVLHVLVFVYSITSISEELHSIFHEDRMCCSALNALHHLYAFILGRACWEALQEEEQEKLKQWEDDHAFSLSWTTNIMIIVLCFVKHFCSLEKTDLTLVALQGMRDCSNYSTQVAATLMAVLTVDFKPTPTDVAMALHKIVQHSQYGPHVRLFFPELFVVLIFQMMSSRALKSLEVTNLPIRTHFCHQESDKGGAEERETESSLKNT